MSGVQFTHDIGDLADDLRTIAVGTQREFRRVVNEGARVGNTVARDYARESAGAHGRHYPKAFTWNPRPTFHGFSASVISAEYGPDIARPQGGMSFEGGSRNSPPHNDLAKSADLVGGSLAREIGDVLDAAFWPER